MPARAGRRPLPPGRIGLPTASHLVANMPGMCDICDGQSPLAAHADFHQKMLRYGWVLQMVEGPSPWSYTIGLETHVGHPDLVIIDLELEMQARLLRVVVDELEHSGGLSPDWLALTEIGTAVVHPDHLDSDRFGQWHRWYGHTPPPGSFVQVLPPPYVLCPCHRSAVRRLDQPGRALSLGNRAQRRAAARRRRG
jgi:hypothetical protein